jgi:hypothetical protein
MWIGRVIYENNVQAEGAEDNWMMGYELYIPSLSLGKLPCLLFQQLDGNMNTG